MKIGASKIQGLPDASPASLDPAIEAFVEAGLQLSPDPSAQRAFVTAIDALEKAPFLNLCRDTWYAIALLPRDAKVHDVLLRGFASIGDMQRKRVMGILRSEALKDMKTAEAARVLKALCGSGDLRAIDYVQRARNIFRVEDPADQARQVKLLCDHIANQTHGTSATLQLRSPETHRAAPPPVPPRLSEAARWLGHVNGTTARRPLADHVGDALVQRYPNGAIVSLVAPRMLHCLYAIERQQSSGFTVMGQAPLPYRQLVTRLREMQHSNVRGDDPSKVEGMAALAWLFAETEGATDAGLRHNLLLALAQPNPRTSMAAALRPYLLA